MDKRTKQNRGPKYSVGNFVRFKELNEEEISAYDEWCNHRGVKNYEKIMKLQASGAWFEIGQYRHLIYSLCGNNHGYSIVNNPCFNVFPECFIYSKDEAGFLNINPLF